MNELTKFQEDGDFAPIYKNWLPSLLVEAQKYVGIEDAKNIVHDVILNVLQKQKWKDIDSLRSYLYKSVKNGCLNFLALHGQKFTQGIDDDFEFREPDNNCLLEKIIEEEKFNELRKSVQALPEKCRKTIEAVYSDGLSHKEAAEKLNVKVGAISKQLDVGKKKLREMLDVSEKMKKSEK